MLGRSDGDDTLVSIHSRPTIQFCAFDEAHRHSLAPALFDDSLQSQIVPVSGDSHPLKPAHTGLKRLGDGVDPVNVIHASQFNALS